MCDSLHHQYITREDKRHTLEQLLNPHQSSLTVSEYTKRFDRLLAVTPKLCEE
jgi:Retrotransposon gag protein